MYVDGCEHLAGDRMGLLKTLNSMIKIIKNIVMNYFNEDHEMFRQSLRDFLQKEAIPNIDKWEEDRKTPREIWKKMGDMGFLGLSYPEEYGGSNLDFFYDVVFNEELGKTNSGGFAITQQVVQYMSGPIYPKIWI